jgi:hypothetical protein
VAIFRSVELPPECRGRLLLHSMPGRLEPLEAVWEEVRGSRIDCIVSLTGLDEIHCRSPRYWEAIVSGRVPCERVEFAIPDFEIPPDKEAFRVLARDLAGRLGKGQRLLVHCAAGIGRTGMLALCTLLALGVSLDEAKAAVSAAGSGAETYWQNEVVAWCAGSAGAAGAEAGPE